MQDWELLKSYVEDGSQAAFATLVERHINFVYSACLREVRDPALAEDVAQVVFLILSKKAASLRVGTVLSGWLFQTARFAAKNALQQETRRRQREQRAAEEMMSEFGTHSDARWEEIEPLLHDALSRLGTQERNAILIRYFENKSLKETGAVLGVSEEAARKRVTRAVEKLRRYFSRHGFILSGAVLAALISANAVRAAPARCITSIMQAATGAAGGTALSSLSGSNALSLYEKVAQAIALIHIRKLAGVLAVLALGTVGVIHIAQRAPANSPGSRASNTTQQQSSVHQGSIEPHLVRTMRPTTSSRFSPEKESNKSPAAMRTSGIRRTGSTTPRKAVLRASLSALSGSQTEQPRLSHTTMYRNEDAQIKIRRTTLKTNRKVRHTRKHSETVKARALGALLGIGAVYGIAGIVPTGAQPPEAAKPVVNVNGETGSKEPEARTIAIEATFVEMSSENLATFGIDFVMPPPTVLASRMVVGIRAKVVETEPTPHTDTLTNFAFGQARQNFKETLDALIAQKRARVVSNPNVNVMLSDNSGHAHASIGSSMPLIIGPGGLMDTSDADKSKIGKSNLFLTTSLGLDVKPSLNADGTITLKLNSPVQMYLQTGLARSLGPVTTFSRSTQPVEVTTSTYRPLTEPGQITAEAINFENVGTGTAMKKGEITTSTQSTETVVTLKDNGAVAMRGIRTRTIKYGKDGNRDLTMWSYVPTLGRLLNNDEATEPEKELVVFITARSVRP